MSDKADEKDGESTSNDDDEARKKAATVVVKPFQHLQFLIRDYQNFDLDWEEDAPDNREFYSKSEDEKAIWSI